MGGDDLKSSNPHSPFTCVLLAQHMIIQSVLTHFCGLETTLVATNHSFPVSWSRLPPGPRLPHVSFDVAPSFPSTLPSPLSSYPLFPPPLSLHYRVPYLLFTTQNSIRRLYLNGSAPPQILVGPNPGRIRKIDYHYRSVYTRYYLLQGLYSLSTKTLH